MFHLRKRFDQLAAKQERKQQRGNRGISRAKSDVLKNVERLYEIPFLILEMVDRSVRIGRNKSFAIVSLLVSDKLQFVVSSANSQTAQQLASDHARQA